MVRRKQKSVSGEAFSEYDMTADAFHHGVAFEVVPNIVVTGILLYHQRLFVCSIDSHMQYRIDLLLIIIWV